MKKISVAGSKKRAAARSNRLAATLLWIVASVALPAFAGCKGNNSPAPVVDAPGTGGVSGAGYMAPAVGTGGTTSAAGSAGGTGGTTSGAGGAGAAAAPATFTAVLAVFADTKNNCALCHAMMLGGGLVFDPKDRQAAYQALVGVVSNGLNGSQCAGRTYVVPFQPDASLLYDKLSNPTPSCGLRMPASGVVLTDTEIATVRAWIQAGAMND